VPDPTDPATAVPTQAGSIGRAVLILAAAVAAGEAIALLWGGRSAGGPGLSRALAAGAGILALSLAGLHLGFLAPLRRALARQAQAEAALRSASRDLDARLEARTASLEAANRSLHQLSARLLRVQEEERTRVARELHGGIGQSLTAVKFMVEQALEGACEGPRSCHLDVLPAIIPVLRQTVEEARRIGMALRPSILDDLGLTATLRWLAREVQKTCPGLEVDLDLRLDEDALPAPLKTSVFRIVQEVLDHAVRYGRAGRVQAALVQGREELLLTVRDDGAGFDPAAAGGPGLDAMRRRAELDRGWLRIDPAPGRGATLTARWPLAAEA
jgi:signal transduction histidine kinase